MKSVTNAHFVKRRINSIIVILNLCYLKLSCFLLSLLSNIYKIVYAYSFNWLCMLLHPLHLFQKESTYTRTYLNNGIQTFYKECFYIYRPRQHIYKGLPCKTSLKFVQQRVVNCCLLYDIANMHFKKGDSTHLPVPLYSSILRRRQENIVYRIWL